MCMYVQQQGPRRAASQRGGGEEGRGVRTHTTTCTTLTFHPRGIKILHNIAANVQALPLGGQRLHAGVVWVCFGVGGCLYLCVFRTVGGRTSEEQTLHRCMFFSAHNTCRDPHSVYRVSIDVYTCTYAIIHSPGLARMTQSVKSLNTCWSFPKVQGTKQVRFMICVCGVVLDCWGVNVRGG